MKYIVYRFAEVNPRILGQTLYLTAEGVWTLERSNAVRFRIKKLAEQKAAEHPPGLHSSGAGMITTTYTAQLIVGGARRIGDRFVRTVVAGQTYAWCVRDKLDHRYDVQQGFCSAEDLPNKVRKAADARLGFIPSYVEWPHD